jgi:fumarylpyruvate hydrolase
MPSMRGRWAPIQKLVLPCSSASRRAPWSASDAVDYPANTESLHHEVELVVLLGQGGKNLRPADCLERIYGYAVGVDLTRRDVQARAKQAGHPWEMSKGFDMSAPIGSIVPAGQWSPSADSRIELQVNGKVRQQAVLGDMIWPVAELIARLSGEVTLHPGDVLFTGTPAGVHALQVGDRVVARVAGLPDLVFDVRRPGGTG